MNIRAYPDTTGYAPRDEQYHAIDVDGYDGAPDGPRSPVGYGPTPAKAIADLVERLNDARREERDTSSPSVTGGGVAWQSE